MIFFKKKFIAARVHEKKRFPPHGSRPKPGKAKPRTGIKNQAIA